MNWEQALLLSSKHLDLKTPYNTILKIKNHEGKDVCITVVHLHNIAAFVKAIKEAVNKCLATYASGFKYKCKPDLFSPEMLYAVTGLLESLKSKSTIYSYSIFKDSGYVEVKVFNEAYVILNATDGPYLH